MQKIDRFTVQTLQLRVPGRCQDDYEIVKPLMDNGSLFSFVTDVQERQSIWENLLNVPTLIPSLYSLGQDKKFLSPLAKALKQLFGDPIKNTLRATMTECFKGSNQGHDTFFVQGSDSTVRRYKGSVREQLHWGILQLYCFASREFGRPRKEAGLPMPAPRQACPAVWASFAQLAYKLGFESDEIHKKRGADPDEKLAEEILLQARKPPFYRYDETQFNQHKTMIAQTFKTAQIQVSSPSTPDLVVRNAGEGLDRRCGRQFELAYEYDRKHTYVPLFWKDHTGSGQGISSLFVRVAVFKAFFGDLILEGTSNGRPEPLNDTITNSEMCTDPIQSQTLRRDEELDDTKLFESKIMKLELETRRLRGIIKEETCKREDAERKLASEVEKCKEVQSTLLKNSSPAHDQMIGELRDCRSANQVLSEEKDELNRKLTELEAEYREKIQEAEQDNSDQYAELQKVLQANTWHREQFNHQKLKADSLEAELSKINVILENVTVDEMKAGFDAVQAENRKLHQDLEQMRSKLTGFKEELRIRGPKENGNQKVRKDNIYLHEQLQGTQLGIEALGKLKTELEERRQDMAQTRKEFGERSGEDSVQGAHIGLDGSKSAGKDKPGGTETNVPDVVADPDGEAVDLDKIVQCVTEAKNELSGEWFNLKSWLFILKESLNELDEEKAKLERQIEEQRSASFSFEQVLKEVRNDQLVMGR